MRLGKAITQGNKKTDKSSEIKSVVRKSIQLNPDIPDRNNGYPS